MEDLALWGNFILEKYGMENQWITKEVKGPYGCTVWRTISNQWQVFWDKVEITVGNGSKTEFWENQWIGGPSLKSTLPVLCIVSKNMLR